MKGYRPFERPDKMGFSYKRSRRLALGHLVLGPYDASGHRARAGTAVLLPVLTSLMFSECVARDSTGTGVPADAVVIYPGQNIQAAVDAHPTGTTCLIKGGVHRLQSVVAKDGDTFVGEQGAILSGAIVLSDFTIEGNVWVANNQTQGGDPGPGACQAGYPRCTYPEDLFVDNVPLLHVASTAALSHGRWFFDYAADKIYLADDPTGHTVETSITRTAITAGPGPNYATGVTVSNLIVEKYANVAQGGALQPAADWVITGVEVRLNHGTGIALYRAQRAKVINSYIHHNGQLGIGGSGDGMLVADNQISYNNTMHYYRGWEAGGGKIVQSRGLLFRHNYCHHNESYGFWLDGDNIDALIEQNRFEDNGSAGFVYEISYDAVIRNNTVLRNGLLNPGDWLASAGIEIVNSANVEIYSNLVHDNHEGIAAYDGVRGSGVYGPLEVNNLNVHDNDVGMVSGFSGLVVDSTVSNLGSFFTTRQNRFEGNRYTLGKESTYFSWANSLLTEVQWQGYGQDTTGVFTHQ